MAVLAAEEVRRAYAHFMRINTDPVAFTKAEGRAAANALAQYLEDNRVALNNVLPAAFKTSATQAQKAILFALVVMREGGILTTEED